MQYNDVTVQRCKKDTDTKAQMYKGTKVKKCNRTLYNDLVLQNSMMLLNTVVLLNGIVLFYGMAQHLLMV